MDLDDEADGVLGQALSRIKPRHPQAERVRAQPQDPSQLADPSGTSAARAARIMGRRRGAG
jgi:hypothetical protein